MIELRLTVSELRVMATALRMLRAKAEADRETPWNTSALDSLDAKLSAVEGPADPEKPGIERWHEFRAT